MRKRCGEPKGKMKEIRKKKKKKNATTRFLFQTRGWGTPKKIPEIPEGCQRMRQANTFSLLEHFTKATIPCFSAKGLYFSYDERNFRNVNHILSDSSDCLDRVRFDLLLPQMTSCRLKQIRQDDQTLKDGCRFKNLYRC